MNCCIIGLVVMFFAGSGLAMPSLGYGRAGMHIRFSVWVTGMLFVFIDGHWKGAGGKDLKSVSVSPKTGHCLTVSHNGSVAAWNGGWIQLPGKAKAIGSGKNYDDEVILTVSW